MSTQTIFFIILAAVVALGLSLLQYYSKNKSKRPKHWILFSALRFITFLSVFLLLINPKFKSESYYLVKPSLVLAIDNSSSIRDFEMAEEVKSLVQSLITNEDLADRFSIEAYSFGENFQRNDSLSFTEKQTNIHKALANLNKLYKNQTAPTVLITDGNQTYGQDYAFSAEKYSQQIYPVVVGDTTKYTDLKMDRLNVNRYAFLNNKFPVEVFLSYNGKEPVNQRFEIKQNNQTVFAENINFNAEKTSAIINAILPANTVGVKTYTATIEVLSAEKNTVNNTKNFAVEVIDEKTNVLLLTDILHPDLGSLKKAIEHNQQRQAEIKNIDDDIDFGNYQLVVFYQPNTKFEAAYQQVERLGLNTFTITGTNTDYRFLNNQQEYFQKEALSQEENYLPRFHADYSVFQLEDIGFDHFPPLKDQFGNLSFNSEYHTLLFQSIDGYATENPLLATLEDNNQRHGFLFGENSWKWRAKSFLDNESFVDYDEFIGKLVQYLASNKKKERLSVDIESFYNSGENIQVQAQYFDKNYEFDPRAKLSILINNQETKQEQNFPFLLKNNLYEVDLSNLASGEYDFTVQVENQNVSESGTFTIVDFDVEKQFLNANTDKLQQVATDSLYYLSSEAALVDKLLHEDSYKPIQKNRSTISPLIEWYYLLIIIILSLSCEWFMRKYNGLI